MFCAYNNELRLRERYVQTDKTENGLELVSGDDFK